LGGRPECQSGRGLLRWCHSGAPFVWGWHPHNEESRRQTRISDRVHGAAVRRRIPQPGRGSPAPAPNSMKRAPISEPIVHVFAP
jgi:hypothetical protein